MFSKQQRTMIFAIVIVTLVVGVSFQLAAGTAYSQHVEQKADQPSLTIPYSGNLKNLDGLPVVDGDYKFSFSLYAQESSGEALWSEIQEDVIVAGGSFEVELGTVSAISKSLADTALWLAVEVQGPSESAFTELSPRQRLNTVSPSSSASSPACPHDHYGEIWLGNSSELGLKVENFGTGDALRAYGNTSDPNYAAIWTRNWGASPAIDAWSQSGYAIKAVGADHTGVYGETHGDWSWKSGVYGKATKDHAQGVTGENTAKGIGVLGKTVDGIAMNARSDTGVALMAESKTNNIIEAWDADPFERRFYVRNDGHVFADGGYHTPAADMAEMLPAAAGLEPGDVLVVDPNGELVRSTEAFQKTVMGVYSTKPGFIGGVGAGAASSNKVPLAIVGIVPVKVTTENGSIVPGDMLVTSSIPGHAMKAGANPPQGTVLGKALAGLSASQSTGMIEILVTLQ